MPSSIADKIATMDEKTDLYQISNSFIVLSYFISR